MRGKGERTLSLPLSATETGLERAEAVAVDTDTTPAIPDASQAILDDLASALKTIHADATLCERHARDGMHSMCAQRFSGFRAAASAALNRAGYKRTAKGWKRGKAA